jgi:hypothetical protein
VLNLWKSSDSDWRTAVEIAATERGALAKSLVFLDHFRDLADPRQRGKVMYPLD